MIKGVIYRLTSPDGKMYYGQTRTGAEYRWLQHLQASRNDKFAKHPLYAAIREYGWDNFTKEVVLECDVRELNTHEISYIEKDNTITPNGYNTMPGGFECQIDEPLEGHQYPLYTVRKHITYDLPPGVAEVCIHRTKTYGFRVYIEKASHTFISKHETMDEKYQLAMDCYNTIKRGEVYHQPNHHKWNKEFYNDLGLDVPEGIKYRKDKGGFEVHVKINGKVHRKTYTKKKFTLEQNLASAIEYLHILKSETQV